MKKEHKEKEQGIQIKSMIHRMNNGNLIIEWRNIRFINNYCKWDDFNNCSNCPERINCVKYLKYEEILTEELIQRGLLNYAVNIVLKDEDFNLLIQEMRVITSENSVEDIHVS